MWSTKEGNKQVNVRLQREMKAGAPFAKRDNGRRSNRERKGRQGIEWKAGSRNGVVTEGKGVGIDQSGKHRRKVKRSSNEGIRRGKRTEQSGTEWGRIGSKPRPRKGRTGSRDESRGRREGTA